MTATRIDYSEVTEAPGTLVSQEAMDMVATRYRFAADISAGKRVLEVACGPGPGLGLLASSARFLVGGDYTDTLLRKALAHYRGRVPLVRLDAAHLPFGDRTFDVVVLFEAIYFLPDVLSFLASCHRVLAPGGTIVIATVNPEWDAFNPSPNSTKYWSASALATLLTNAGFRAELYGGFPGSDPSLRGNITATLKRIAIRFHLIPQTMKGKEFLKRLAFGTLSAFPAEVVPETGTYHPPSRIADPRAPGDFKVLYAVAHRT